MYSYTIKIRTATMLFFCVMSLIASNTALGQNQASSQADHSGCLYVFQEGLKISNGGLYVYAKMDSNLNSDQGCNLSSMEEPVNINSSNYYVKSGFAVFNGPIEVTAGGVYIGHHGKDIFGGRGWAVFNAPVSINAGHLTARGNGQAVFNNTVSIYHGGIYLEDKDNDWSSMTFQSAVNIDSGHINLKGGNSAIFTNDVRIKSGGLYLEHDDGRASVTLAGKGNITAQMLKVIGGNKLVFSLSSSMPATGFIDAGSYIIVDPDCLVIDNPDDVLREGEEIILITGDSNIQLNEGTRKIITKQGDEFELQVDEKQISAKLKKRAKTSEGFIF